MRIEEVATDMTMKIEMAIVPPGYGNTSNVNFGDGEEEG